MSSSKPTFFATDFKLSITKALADQLAEKLDINDGPLRRAPLTKENIDSLEPRPGVYLLFHNGQRVYVGKAQKSLPSRLLNHRKKLSGRKNISLEEISFICLYVDEDLDAAAPERLLIKKYRQTGESAANGVPWNTNGFGNKDPGKNRDTSEVASNHFDAQYPINLAFRVQGLELGDTTLAEYLSQLKTNLPYNLRFEKKGSAKQAYKARVHVTQTMPTAQEAIDLAIQALPEQWQVTALPGYLILYPNPKQISYPSATFRWIRTREGVDAQSQEMKLAPVAEFDERETDPLDEDID
ncbi:GIY-YIG nuclease family protein [Myxococcus qinghaiensis]|uniref:GIY-YIG nuclease family protein n=1 Tax=Myxococcus qinghaiensis TaxID=2906758 RepID=UPI0020A75404|nr:GIY-YIG nuclease family protein [Myxococcus qinghaiensis]MCP3170192.1 GIY-YIG nuclease family protein [Myxococcus qinghaiensis]